jgi:hypothetical protein
LYENKYFNDKELLKKIGISNKNIDLKKSTLFDAIGRREKIGNLLDNSKNLLEPKNRRKNYKY